MTVEERVRNYVEANLQHVSLEEVTSLPLVDVERSRPKWRLVAGVAAAAVLVVTAGVVWAVRSGAERRTITVVDTAPATAPTTPTATTAVIVPSSPVSEVAKPMTPEQFGEIVTAALASGDTSPVPEVELRAADVRPASDGTPSLFADLSGDDGRLLVQAVEGELDVTAYPPYPGDVAFISMPYGQHSTWVWPVDPQYNTVAVATDRRTIVVRLEASAPLQEPLELAVNGSILVNQLLGIALAVDAQMGVALGEQPTSSTLVPVEGTTLVPLDELDAPGERTLLTESDQELADGPLIDAAGRTYGVDNDDTPLSSVDFRPIMAPADARQVVVGFISTEIGIPGNGGGITLVYGVTGDVVGWFRQIDVTDAHGTYLWSDSEFTQAPASGDVPIGDLPELVAHDLDSNQVLTRDELRASAGALRRVIRGDGTQGNVYATDLVPFLESVAGVDDPTSGAVSLVVPFFGLDLQPAGTIDLGAADTVIFDEAGQPIGGW